MEQARIIGVSAVVLLALAGCADRGRGRADAGICAPFNAVANNAGAPGGQAATLDDCLHRAAYKLARASDSADIVAQATVAACSDELSRWNTASVSTPVAAGGTPDTAVDLITGQSASQIAQRYQYAQGRALYYVVQGRAGRCDVPAVGSATAVR